MTHLTSRHWLVALLAAAGLQAAGALWLMPSTAREPEQGAGGVEISLSLAGAVSAGAPAAEKEALEPITPPQPQPLPEPEPEPEPVKPKPEPVKPKPVERPKPTPPKPSKAQATRAAPEKSEKVDTRGAPPRQSAAAPTQSSAGGESAAEAAGVAAAQLDYFSLLAATLNKHKRYPYPAKRARHEGIVKLRFVIDKEGNLLDYAITGSSGYALLDNAVIEMLKRAAPLPAIPDHLNQDQLTIALPIEFSLRRR